MTRRTFTDADLDDLSFHDVRVLGYAALRERHELRFDVDYLVEWLCPEDGSGTCTFRISPATLVFLDVTAMEISLRSPEGEFALDALVRSDLVRPEGASPGPWQFELRPHEGGYVRVRAMGFQLHLRAEPLVADQQELSLAARGGVSFEVPGEPLTE